MIRKQKLSNGMVLLTESMPHVRSVSVGVWLNRGSRNESKRVNGISHFIEHLVFKGTRSRTARQIALEMDSVGGQLDAFTSRESTCFYAKVLDDHLPVAIDLLSDIVQDPLFDAQEIERERQVVLEEIRMIDDSPEQVVYDLFSENFFPSHPLGRPIQGTTDSVEGLSRRQLVNFFREAYQPHNMLITAAGHLSHAKLRRQVEKAFGGMKTHARKRVKQRMPKAKCGMVVRPKKGLEQLHLLFGVPAFEREQRRRYPILVFNALLGDQMSSRLFQRVREERGLAYSVYSGLSGYRDAGVLQIYAGVHPKRCLETVDTIVTELRDLRDNGPTDEELQIAKEHLKGSMMLGLESTSSRMVQLAQQEIFLGRQLDLNEALDGIDRVSQKDVHRVAKKLFDGATLALAAVGSTPRRSAIEKRLKL